MLWGAAPAPGAGPSVLGARQFSTADYARIVLILDRETFDFTSGALRRPARIFLDIPGGRIARGTRMPIFEPGRSVVSRLRSGRPRRGVLRLVIDLSPGREVAHRVFTLPGPHRTHRIVIDLHARGPARSGEGGAARRPPREPKRKFPARREMTLAQRFRRGVGRIVLDPAHGGKDPGAVGLYGLMEKEVALDISHRLRRILRRALPGNRIYLTRTADRYLSLPERTSFATEHDADMFVSIHANSARSRRLRGIETYFLSEASDKRALALAARENGTSVARMSDLQKILGDLGFRSKVAESRQLAQRVQSAMLARLRGSYRGARDLGVKRAPFYVLIGARMPSVLIEVGFISNPKEARWIQNPRYRQALAEGIAEGMMRFIGVGHRKAGRAAPAR